MSEMLTGIESPAPVKLAGPRPRLKVLGILGLLVGVCVITSAMNGAFLKENNVEALIHRTAMFAILGIGVAFVIITGGIDLSIGSVVAVVGLLLPLLVKVEHRTVGQGEVLEVSAGVPRAVVQGDLSAMKAGDALYLSGEGGGESAGKAVRAILRVASARFDPRYEFFGRKGPATELTLTAPAPNTVAAGKAARAVPIAAADAAAGTVTLPAGSAVAPKDRLTLIRADATGIYELDVTRAEAAAGTGEVRVTLAEPAGRLSADHAWAVLQAHRQLMEPTTAIPLLLALAAAIGLVHGLLITKLKLQPFMVTLCGLLIYRSLARVLTSNQTQGFGTSFPGLRALSTGSPFAVPVPFLNYLADRSTGGPLITWIDVPNSFLIMVAIAIVAAVFLNRTIYGRYLLALGRNEQAARYSGINTDAMVILAYVICSFMAGLAGMLFIFDTNTGQPSDFGNVYELYAIAAAVLGGCSLRGGEGTILGVIIGAAVMRVLYNAIILLGIPDMWELFTVGAVILLGAIADELAKRYTARRRAARQAG